MLETALLAMVHGSFETNCVFFQDSHVYHISMQNLMLDSSQHQSDSNAGLYFSGTTSSVVHSLQSIFMFSFLNLNNIFEMIF